MCYPCLLVEQSLKCVRRFARLSRIRTRWSAEWTRVGMGRCSRPSRTQGVPPIQGRPRGLRLYSRQQGPAVLPLLPQLLQQLDLLLRLGQGGHGVPQKKRNLPRGTRGHGGRKKNNKESKILKYSSCSSPCSPWFNLLTSQLVQGGRPGFEVSLPLRTIVHPAGSHPFSQIPGAAAGCSDPAPPR